MLIFYAVYVSVHTRIQCMCSSFCALGCPCGLFECPPCTGSDADSESEESEETSAEESEVSEENAVDMDEREEDLTLETDKQSVSRVTNSTAVNENTCSYH